MNNENQSYISIYLGSLIFVSNVLFLIFFNILLDLSIHISPFDAIENIYRNTIGLDFFCVCVCARD